MNSWSEVSEKNLFPFSKEQADFETALQEWEHTGAVVDHFYPIESCQLCEHANVRYHFEIINRETEITMQVGSSCIEQFGIRVYNEEGEKLSGKAREKQLQLEIKIKKEELVYASLLELWKASDKNQDKVIFCTREYQERGKFSPRNLLYLFQQMDEKGIRYVPHIYKVTLRNKAERESLYRMSESELEIIWDSLSATQKKGYFTGRKAYDAKVEKEKSALQKTSTTNSLPDFPIRYSERAHKYKVTFIDYSGAFIKRLFRGRLSEIRSLVKKSIAENPNYAKAEVRITQTNEVVEIYP